MTRTAVALPIMLIFLISAMAFSATYYVSVDALGGNAAGSNSADGTLATPWATIQYGSDQLSAGDTLYVRGGIYYEEVTLTTQGTSNEARITIAAYDAEVPILSGSIAVTSWTQCTSSEAGLTKAGKTNSHYPSIYKAVAPTSGTSVSNLSRMFYEEVDDVLVHGFLARWPEQSEGYGVDPTEFQDVPTECVGKTNSLKDNIYLNQNDSRSPFYAYINGLSEANLDLYFAGLVFQIWFKTEGNTTRSYTVGSYVDGSNEVLATTFLAPLKTDDAYCFYGHPHLVNAPGKFYSDLSSGSNLTIYYYPRVTGTPAEIKAALDSGIVRMPKLGTGIYASNKDYITIDGITVQGFEDVGIHFINATSTGVTIKNSKVEDCGQDGIYLLNTASATIDTCEVNRVGDRGIFLNTGTNGIIKNSSSSDNKGTCISFYTMTDSQIIDNKIHDARGVHVNGVSCYQGCKKVLIGRNVFDPGVNLAIQCSSDFVIYGNILDSANESAQMVSLWEDSENSNYASQGYMLFLHNTLINAVSPGSMYLIQPARQHASFTGATIDNNGGYVRLTAVGQMRGPEQYGTYNSMIYCDFSATYTDGWYMLRSHNLNDSLTINLAYSSSVPTCSGYYRGKVNNHYVNNIFSVANDCQYMYADGVLNRLVGYNVWMDISRNNYWFKTYTFNTNLPSTFSDGSGNITAQPWTSRNTLYAACFTDYNHALSGYALADYSLKEASPARSAGASKAYIDSILDSTTIGLDATSIRTNFSGFDFTKDVNGETWDPNNPSIGAMEYAGGGVAPTDTTAPTPNPATFSSAPAVVNSTSITMTATAGVDATGPVYYSFVSATGPNSGEQTNRTYTPTGLTPDTEYTYTVQMRDSAPAQNTGAASSAASATTTATAAINLTDAIVVFYKCNDSDENTTVADSSGHSLNAVASANTDAIDATHSGSPTGLGAGYFTLAHTSTQTITATDAGGVLDLGTANWSMAAWVKTTDTGTNPRRIFHGTLDNSYEDPIRVYLRNSADDELRFGFPYNSTYDDYMSPADPCAIADGNWKFVVVNCNRTGTVDFYVDGVLDGAVSWPRSVTSISFSMATLVLGSGWTGSIDNFQLFNRLLTTDEIAFLYAAGEGTESLVTVEELLPPLAAINPYPTTGTVDTETSLTLTWVDGGSGAVTYDVYFGTAATPVTKVIDAQQIFEYETGALGLNTTYYWRVDSTNAAGTTTGTVWSFDTIDYITYTTIEQINEAVSKGGNVHIAAGIYILTANISSSSATALIPIDGDVVFDNSGYTFSLGNNMTFDTSNGYIVFTSGGSNIVIVKTGQLGSRTIDSLGNTR